MAHVQKRGDRYLATYKGPDGRRHSKRFDRKRDADAWIAEQTVDVRAGRWIDDRAGRVTLGEYAREWVRDRSIRETTRAGYVSGIKHLAELDGVPLAQLDPAAMRRWQRGLSDRVKPSTAMFVRRIVGSILNTAVTDRRIPASPLDGVPLPTDHDVVEVVHPMTVAEVFDLRELITPGLAAAITLGAGAGLRRGEAMGVTVDRVDFLRKTVKVDRQLVGGSIAAGPVFGPLKTRSSYRTVPLPDVVVDALAEHLAAFGEGPQRLVFAGGRGAPMTPGRFTPVWRYMLTRRWMRDTGRPLTAAGNVRRADLADYVRAHPDGSDFTYHDLRHFYASRLIGDGQSVKVVQARLGHKTAAETLNTYAHLWPDDEDRTRSALDRALAPRRDEGDEGAAGGLSLV